MNLKLLNIETQEFIDNNLNSEISKLILKGSEFQDISNREIVEQIEAKKKCILKLPTWFASKGIYYSNKLNIEQTSSEITAEYKSKLFSGNSIIDITGGFGVDTFYFSKRFKDVTHCEINAKLSRLAKHNFEVLNASNIDCINTNGIDFLEKKTKHFDWIFVDPSRRNNLKGKVFYLKDCKPNLVEQIDILLEHSNNIMVKVSPMLDLSIGISELKYVKEIHIVAFKNEVKELLYIIEKNYDSEIKVKTINITKENQVFEFYLDDVSQAQSKYSDVKKYLYEPNAALMKSGAFNFISQSLNIDKLHSNTHLYTSNNLINFPGRIFEVVEVLPYHKKTILSKIQSKNFNISTRNFPESVQQLKKKFKTKDGGSNYLFFTTNYLNRKIQILTIKA